MDPRKCCLDGDGSMLDEKDEEEDEAAAAAIAGSNAWSASSSLEMDASGCDSKDDEEESPVDSAPNVLHKCLAHSIIFSSHPSPSLLPLPSAIPSSKPTASAALWLNLRLDAQPKIKEPSPM